MRLRLWTAVSLALLAVLPAAAQTADERRQLDWVLERGRLLFGLDRAAWVATDDLLSRLPNAQQSGVRGYIVERDADGFAVTFYAPVGERLVAAYRARIGRGGVERPEVFQGPARPALSPAQMRLARTAETVRRTVGDLQRCGTAPFNLAIVPPATPDGPIDAYLMTPQPSAAAYPLGGHHRITFNAAGVETNRRSFARSCLTLTKAAGPRGEQPVGMVASHLLDPVPTEIHVFTAMAAQVPVFVAIQQPQRTFAVSGRGIDLVERPGRR